MIQRLVGLLFHAIKAFVFVDHIGEFPYVGQKRPIIIVSNHHSFEDVVIWGSVAPLRHPYTPAQYQGKPSLFENPVLAALCWMIGIVRIERGSGKPLEVIVANALAALERGKSVFLFIEGGRSRDPIIQKGKSGPVFLGMKTGFPIVPLAIGGTLDNGQNYGVAVGAPIVFDKRDEPSVEETEMGTTQVVAAIADLQRQLAKRS